jgi:outer membrane receptor protein involved in Fe transport
MFTNVDHRKLEPICRWSAWLLLSLMCATVLRAQVNSTATIQGTVTDSSGAVVSGATVQVRNNGTDATQNAVSDAQGRYSIPSLPIGNYDVQASTTGFQTVLHKGVTLTVGNTTLVDFSLPVGTAQQTVTVEGEVTQVQTSDSAIASLIEPTQMTQLPLNGRNFEQLLLLEPGVQSTQAGGSFYGTQNDYSIAGSRPQGQAFLLDGSDIATFWDHGTGSGATGNSLGIDGIAEFQALTDTYSAQYGGNGAVVNATTKSGTNGFHGTAYEFLRNSALDARNYFDPAKIPEFRRNQFGGSLGGPVKKDRAFFFVNYEGLRQSLGQGQPVNAPDAAAHRGYLPLVPNGPVFPIPSTNPLCTPVFTPTSNCVAANIASTLALYPTAPTDNVAPGVGNVTEVASQTASENYLVARFDYTISEKDSFFLRYIRDTASQVLPFTGSNVPLWPEDDTTANHFATIGERHLFSSNLINLVHFEFDRPKDVGFTSASQAATRYFPGREDGSIQVANSSGGPNGLLANLGANNLLPFSLPQDKFVFADDILWTHGAHSFAIGMSVKREYTYTFAPFQYGGQWTFPNLPAFLEGKPSQLFSAAAGNVVSNKDFRELFLSPYFNDTWKITPKLTLNYGIRWDWETDPIQTAYGMQAFPNPPVGAAPGCSGGGCFVEVTHAFASNFNYKNWEPRIGIAYDPFGDHKTSIRAGFGIFDDVVVPREYMPGYWLDPPFQLAFQVDPPYPTPFGTGGLSFPIQPIQPEGQAYDWKYTPYEIQYNLNVQREIAPNTVLTVGYVGSQGIHLVQAIDVNPPGTVANGKAVPYINNGTPWPVQQGAGPCTTLPPPDGHVIFGCLDPSGVVVNPLQQANPTLGRLSERTPLAHSHYNSLQVSLDRRFTNNVQAQLSYTYSKSIDNGSISSGLEAFSNGNQLIMNPYKPSQDVGPSDFNQTHSFRASSVIALPFRGNPFVQGWQLSGILSANSGYPIVLSTGYDGSGEGFDRPNLLPGASPRPRTLGNPNQWWSASGFTMPAIGEFGNVGRNTALGPGFLNLDFALLKDTAVPKVSEQFKVEFRAEFFDIINHTNFLPPNSGLFVPCLTAPTAPACIADFAGSHAGSGGFEANPTFGQIASTTGNAATGGSQRVIQFALKLIF